MVETQYPPPRPAAGGLKQRELTKCACCGEGMMHDRNITFFRLELSHMIINQPAVVRQHGLEMQMGKAAPLAQIMGPDEDMALPVTTCAGLICFTCGMKPLHQIFEDMGAADEASA